MASLNLHNLAVLFSFGKMRRAIALGFKTLWLHRLRSFLTMLGIVFGVCSVIAMLAVGEGAGYEAQEQIRRLGSQNIILRSIKPAEGQSMSSEQSRVLEYGLTYDDMRRIETTLPSVRVLAPGAHHTQTCVLCYASYRHRNCRGSALVYRHTKSVHEIWDVSFRCWSSKVMKT